MPASSFLVPAWMSSRRSTSDADTTTRTVVSNLKVIAAGTRYDQQEAKDGKPIPTTVVTLLATPEDAERVTLASLDGKILLVLRNPLDTEPTNTSGVKLDGLDGIVLAAARSRRPSRAAGRLLPRLRLHRHRRLRRSVHGGDDSGSEAHDRRGEEVSAPSEASMPSKLGVLFLALILAGRRRARADATGAGNARTRSASAAGSCSAPGRLRAHRPDGGALDRPGHRLRHHAHRGDESGRGRRRRRATSRGAD